MAYQIPPIKQILTAVLCACAIGHGFLLPHAEVTDPLQSIYHGTRNAGRSTRASWLVTRNAFPPSATRPHVANSYIPFTPEKRSYTINKLQHYTDMNPELYLEQVDNPLTSDLSKRKKRSIQGNNVVALGSSKQNMRFARRVQKVQSGGLPLRLDGGEPLTGDRQSRAIWLQSKKNAPSDSVPLEERASWLHSKKSSVDKDGERSQGLPKIANRANWLPSKRTDHISDSVGNGVDSRATWLPVKRLPATGIQVDKPQMRANWLQVKKDIGDGLNTKQQVELEGRAHWLPSKKDSGDNELEHEEHQAIDSRASWLPSKRTEYTDEESMEALQNDGMIQSRASWLLSKKDHTAGVLSEKQDKEPDTDKKAFWLPNKRHGLSQDHPEIKSTPIWLKTKRQSNDVEVTDNVENDIKRVRKEELKQTTPRDKDKSETLNRHQRSLSNHLSRPLTVSPMGHFINGRSQGWHNNVGGHSHTVDGAGRQNNQDEYGYLMASQAKEIDPQYLQLYSSNDAHDDEEDTDANAPQYAKFGSHQWMPPHKRIPTSRAVSDHGKMHWDFYNARAMWLPMRDVAEKRIPTDRSVYNSDPYQGKLGHGFFPSTYPKRIPTERELYHDDSLLSKPDKRIPTERAFFTGGIDSIYDSSFRSPTGRYGSHTYSGYPRQHKRIPTERGIYSGIPTS